MAILRRVGRQPYRHEVFQLGNSVRQQEARNQDVRGRPIELFVPHAIRVGRNPETAAILVIQKRAENAGESKCQSIEPLMPTCATGAHVADDSIIFYRLIRHRGGSSCWAEMKLIGLQPMSVFFAKLASFAKPRDKPSNR